MGRITTGCLLGCLLLSGPLLAQENWRLRAPAEGDDDGCYLYTPTVRIADGQGLTNVTLRLDKKRLLVITDSNIDAEYNDIGLQVDEEQIIDADALLGETNVIFRRAVPTVTKQFIAGKSVSINLRFWPTWPTTGLKHAEFSLIGFTKAYRQFETCR